jgi:phage FluMu gp28-like protein
MGDKHFGSSVYDIYTLNRHNIKDIIVSIKAIYISGYSFNIRKKQNILMKKKNIYWI